MKGKRKGKLKKKKVKCLGCGEKMRVSSSSVPPYMCDACAGIHHFGEPKSNLGYLKDGEVAKPTIKARRVW